MPSSRVVLPPAVVHDGRLDLDALRDELDLPGPFSAQALAEAETAAARPRLPAVDRTDLPFVILDPLGSQDLDQAVHVTRSPVGYRVWYAIADVAAFVVPGGALDAEVEQRGVTLYAPDRRVPLHPPVLGEQAASLLPDGPRPAVLWELDLDRDGELTGTSVRRALVRSRARLDYAAVQAELDSGAADHDLVLLREVGLLRQERARPRGAVDLPTPEQDVELDAESRPQLVLRAPLPVEGWNAQISLLTGAAAAALMLSAGIGLLRTLPPAAEQDVAALRRSAAGAAAAQRGGGAVRPLHRPAAAAGRPARQRGLPRRRGRAGDPRLGALGAAAAAGAHDRRRPARRGPRAGGGRHGRGCRAGSPGRRALRRGRRRGGGKGGVVQLASPPVRARCGGTDLPLGERLLVELVTADPVTRTVLFRAA